MRVDTEFISGSSGRVAATRLGLVRRLMATGVVALLALGVAGCAPEPMAGSHVKGQDPEKKDQSWSQIDDQDDPALKSKELPEGFPNEEFALPAGAVVDDAGKRGDRTWFVVLKASSAAEAEQWWDAIIETNGLTAHDEEKGDGGSVSATLSADALTATALTIPNSDGSMMLSYDITQEF